MSKFEVTRRAYKIYCSYNPKHLPLLLAKIIFSNISPYFNLWMSSEIVTALYQGRTMDELFLLVVITLLGNLFIKIMEAILIRAEATADEILENNQAAAFNRKTLSLDYDKLEDPQIQRLRRKILENSWINGYGILCLKWSTEMLFAQIANLVFCLILFTEMVSLIFRRSFYWNSLLLLIIMIIAMVAAVVLQARCGAADAAGWKEIGDMMLWENQMSRGLNIDGMDNRIYRQQDIINKLEKKAAAHHLRICSTAYMKHFWRQVPTYAVSKIPELCSYLIVCFYCTLGAFSVGSVIKYVGYLINLTKSFDVIFTCLNELKSNEPFLETYLEFFDLQNDMYQGSLAVEKRSDKRFDIEFQNVTFRYAGADSDALKNINLKVKVGERLAVVGMNGSGKTTFIKLLCRLYDPTKGEIFMNDFNIRKYDYRQYLDLFSVVFQDYNLLAVPLGNNISAEAVWDTQKAEKLLNEVGFGERYQEMAKKLHTPLYKEFDEDGVNVSGGEAQKIALARALYKDAPFIILDEPTAALDPIAEAEIYANFDEIVGDKTAIYISHRLSSCRFCDKIAVFDNGQIVQMGTHEELLADPKGKYHELWYAQAQYYQKN